MKLLSRVRRNPSAVLLVVQLLGVLVYPAMEGSLPGRVAFEILGIVLLVLAVFSVRATPGLTWVSICLGIPAVGLSLLDAFDPTDPKQRSHLDGAALPELHHALQYRPERRRPDHSWGRSVVMIEQLAGLGYVAMVVSRLVGLTLTNQQHLDPRPSAQQIGCCTRGDLRRFGHRGDPVADERALVEQQ